MLRVLGERLVDHLALEEILEQVGLVRPLERGLELLEELHEELVDIHLHRRVLRIRFLGFLG